MKHRRNLALLLALVLLAAMLPTAQAAVSEATRDFCPSPRNQFRHMFYEERRDGDCSVGTVRVTYRCMLCDYQYTESQKAKHDYGSWRVTREATCTREGERVRVCRVCGHEDRQKTEKAPHNYGAWTVTREATCAETGERTRTCRDCGHVDVGTIKKAPHTWGAWEITEPATDHSSGTRTRVCQVCGERETETFDPEGTLRRGAKGEEVKELQQGLICYGTLKKGGADGSYGKGTERAVRALQEAEGMEADGVAWPRVRTYAHHNFGEWRTLSKLTRTTDGVRERTCLRCGLVERDVAEAKPLFKRGDRGKPVSVIQDIIWDLGYDPGKIDGVYGPALDRVVGEWSRDHDWYFEPGLIKPIDIDRIVNHWADARERYIGVSGENTPVNLKIEIAPEFTMLYVVPGENVKYRYTVTNLGTEDCKLGPLFVSYREDMTYVSDERYLRYVGDLSGEVLKANGANSYTGYFTVAADMDKAAPEGFGSKDRYCIYVNAWVLGTSLADSRRWYSNIAQRIMELDWTDITADPNLVLTGRVLDERTYTLGEEFEYEVAVTNNTDKDLNVYIESVGHTWEGASAIIGEEESELLPVGETMTRNYSHRLCHEDEIVDGKYPFWLEAHGYAADDTHVVAPQASLWVDVVSPYFTNSDALVLSRESDDPKGTHYPVGETWRYRYRATNNGDVELHDVRVNAYLSQYGYWTPLNEVESGTLAAGAHGDLEGERAVGMLRTSVDYNLSEDNKWVAEYGYEVDIIAQGLTPEGDVVFAKPIKEWVPIDTLDDNMTAHWCLHLEGRIVDPKDEYVEGDEVEVEVSLRNLSGVPLKDYTFRPLLGPDDMDDTYDDLGEVRYEATVESGETVTHTFPVKLTRMWDVDEYHLMLHAEGTTEDGIDVASNYVYNALRVLPGDKEPEKHSLPIPSDISKIMSGNKPPVPDGAIGEDGVSLPRLRSLEIVKQSKSDHDYYENAKVPVLMRLTIDEYDTYDLVSIEPAPGDSVSDEPWMHDVLQPGQSYDFTYTMVLDRAKTGWKPRTVTALLHSHSLDVDEVESCKVKPPWVPATVTIEDPNVHIINDNMSYLYLYPNYAHLYDKAYPNDLVYIPYTVDSDGNTTIRNVRFNCLEKLNGETVYAWGGPVTDKMEPGDTFPYWSTIAIRGTKEGQPKGYELEMWLTGTIYNKKGKQETIRSKVATADFTVLDPAEGKKILDLTCTLEPKKSGYAVNDVVNIRCRVTNHYGEDLRAVTIRSWGDEQPMLSIIKGQSEVGKLLDGDSREVVITYIIKPEDVLSGKIEGHLLADGIKFNQPQANKVNMAEHIKSRPIKISIGINDPDLPKQLAVSASLEHSGPVKALEPMTARLTVTNNADQRVVRTRVYAVGDNRFDDHDAAVAWHDCGHGLKGWLCGESTGIASGDARYIDVPVCIPFSFVQKGKYVAQWIVEADLQDNTGTVTSNIATITVNVTQSINKLDLFYINRVPNKEVYKIGDSVIFTLFASNPAGNMPDDIVFYGYLQTSPEDPVKEKSTSIIDDQAYASFSFTIREENVVDGLWQADIVARAFDDTVESNPVPLFISVKDDEAPEEPGDSAASDLILHAYAVTESDNPEGLWENGDQVEVHVDAVYQGPEIPKALMIEMTDAHSGEGLWITDNYGAVDIEDNPVITLESSRAVDGVCAYEFRAYGYIEDSEVSDCASEIITLTFDMAPAAGGPDDMPGAEPEGGAEGPEKKINWTAIDKAKEKIEGKDGEGTEAASESGGTEVAAEGIEGAEAASEGGKGTEDANEGGNTEKADPDGSDGKAVEVADDKSNGKADESADDKDDGKTTITASDGSDGKADETADTDGDDKSSDEDQPKEDGQPSEEGEPVKDGQPEEGGQPSEDDQPKEDSQPVEEGEPSEGGQPSDYSEPTGSADEKPVMFLEDDVCTCVQVGQGEGTARFELTLCVPHKAVFDAALALTVDSGTAEAWQQAVDLWIDALNAEYDALCEDVNAEEAVLIREEQARYLAWLENRQAALAHTTDPARAARETCAALMERAAELCRLWHGVPVSPMADEATEPMKRARVKASAREIDFTETGATITETLAPAHLAMETAANALLSGAELPEQVWRTIGQLWRVSLDGAGSARRLSAGAEAAQAYIEEDEAFDQWLEAYEEFLNLMEPDNPEDITKAVAQAIRSQALAIG